LGWRRSMAFGFVPITRGKPRHRLEPADRL